jgi:hypothetical protein
VLTTSAPADVVEGGLSQRDKRLISAASYARHPNLEDTDDTFDSSDKHRGKSR